jgi:hypothetical protein
VITMSKYAIVDNGVVINIVVWDGAATWSPDSGEPVEIKDSVFVDLGYLYSNEQFTAPEESTND